jgi:hypothetical protein
MPLQSARQIGLFDLPTTSGALAVVRGNLDDAMPLILAHHYTGRRTADPMHVFLWQRDGETQAAAVYCAPANKFFGKGSIELARLVRLPALADPLSRFVAETLRWLRRHTELAYCLSYSDEGAGHHGGIYQALSFVHVARTKGNVAYRNPHTGAIVSGRSFDQRRPAYQTGWERHRTARKLLYVFPLRERRTHLLRRFNWVALPYPKPDRKPA